MSRERLNLDDLDVLIEVGEEAKEIKKKKEALCRIDLRLEKIGDMLEIRERLNKQFSFGSFSGIMILEDEFEESVFPERILDVQTPVTTKPVRKERKQRIVSMPRINRDMGKINRALKKLSDLPMGDIFVDFRDRLVNHIGKKEKYPSQTDYECPQGCWGIHPADEV